MFRSKNRLGDQLSAIEFRTSASIRSRTTNRVCGSSEFSRGNPLPGTVRGATIASGNQTHTNQRSKSKSGILFEWKFD